MAGTKLILARIWYLLVGGIASLIAVGSLAGPILGGCRIAFSQADMGRAGPCVQYLDPLFLAQAFAVGGLALVAGVFVLSRQRLVRAVVPLGIAVGGLAGFVPAAILVWAMDFYRYTLSPGEIAMGLVPASLGIAAAISLSLAWWHAGRGVPERSSAG